MGVRATQVSLLADLTTGVSDRSPDFVLIDIQRDQREGVTALVAAVPARSPPQVTPLMRGRVVAVEGARLTARLGRSRARASAAQPRVRLDVPGSARGQRGSRRAGTFWSTDDGASLPAAEAPGASIPRSRLRSMREDDGLSLGDVVRFDVAGAPLSARVTSVRRVKWEDSQSGGFVFVLRPAPAVEARRTVTSGFCRFDTDAAPDAADSSGRSSRPIRTSRSSTCATSSRRSGTWSTTSPSA